jgi:hypothetical protein
MTCAKPAQAARKNSRGFFARASLTHARISETESRIPPLAVRPYSFERRRDMLPRFRLSAFALAGLAAFACAGEAGAGWVTFKNDTNKAVVVQEFLIVNGRKMCGKPYKLLPGESFREFQNTGGVKNYDVYDAAVPNKPAWSNPLDCGAAKQSFSVALVRGRVTVRGGPQP